MNPARLARENGRAVALVTCLLTAAGVIAYGSLPSSIYPSLQFPRVVVIAHSGTLPARSMMLGVTRPVEEAIMEVPGIRRVRSLTFRGASEISAQFEPRADIVLALQQVQNRTAEIRGQLPAETELTIERMTPATFPVLGLALTGGLAEADLRDYGFYVLRPALARIPGVGRVEVAASDTREIEVVVDPGRLQAAGLTAAEVSEVLRASNQIVPVGRYPSGGLQYLVLASGLWASAADVGRTPVAVRKGVPVRVADVAEVFPGTSDRTQLVVGNGQPAAIVNVSQQVGASILDLRQDVQRVLEEQARTLPAGLRISLFYDLASFVSDAIASVRDAILVGGALAVVVLYAFLRRWRLTAIAALTLPVTVVSTFAFMHLAGESINLMSMGGLAVAIGLVIDDAVVVVENIHRRRALGEGPAAVDAASAELVAPVVGSTLTSVVVFAPLGLLSGVVGQFFKALSITLSAAVLLSLVLAFTLIPLLARWAEPEAPTAAAPGRLEALYVRWLAAAMARPGRLAAVAVGLALGAAALFFGVPTGFLPRMDEGGFVIDYVSPPGSALEETDRIVGKVEAILAKMPEVASFSRRTGAELGMFATQQNKGDLLVRLKRRSERRRSADEVIEELRPRIRSVAPELEIEFIQLLQDMIGDLEGNPTPIEIKIFGDDPERLAELAEELEPRVREVRGVVDLVGMPRTSPEVTWQVDPAAAGRLGLSVARVSEQLQTAWLGEIATQLRLLDRTIPVRVRYPDAVRFDPASLASTTLRGSDGALATLASIARPVTKGSEGVLLRENLRQMALLTARLEGRDLAGAVAELRSRLSQLRLPIGYGIEVGGQYDSERQAFRELMMVFAIAVSLVLVVLVVEFRAFTPALLILAAAPLSFAGSLLVLFLTRTELNVSSAMGFILLVGLSVKNGIVMLDYAHRLRGEGQPLRQAVENAARIRLRPILMTTLCTLFGLLPLALGWGSGAELQKPLALVVIGGLILSTLVTLFAVPTFYVAARGARS